MLRSIRCRHSAIDSDARQVTFSTTRKASEHLETRQRRTGELNAQVHFMHMRITRRGTPRPCQTFAKLSRIIFAHAEVN